MISTSTCLMVTGSWLMPSTHAPSHGAGHSRPVNSGKLLVAWRRSMASRQWSRQTRSFQSGMRLPERAAVVAERDAAVHAPAGLGLEVVLGEVLVDLLPVVDAHRDRAGGSGALGPCLRKPLMSAMSSSPSSSCVLGRRLSAARRQAMIASSTSMPSASARALGLEHPLVVLGHDLLEVAHVGVPPVEDPLGHGRAGLGVVTAHDVAQPAPGRPRSSGSRSTISVLRLRWNTSSGS